MFNRELSRHVQYCIIFEIKTNVETFRFPQPSTTHGHGRITAEPDWWACFTIYDILVLLSLMSIDFHWRSERADFIVAIRTDTTQTRSYSGTITVVFDTRCADESCSFYFIEVIIYFFRTTADGKKLIKHCFRRIYGMCETYPIKIIERQE